MTKEVFFGLMIPFLGTSLGAACVYILKENVSEKVELMLTGFAAGVMVAASIWSLLIPALEEAANLGRLSFMPAAIGFWLGILFLLAIDHLTPHLHVHETAPEGPHSSLKNQTLMMLAVTIHNIPEGMAVGVVYAAFLYSVTGMSASGALALSLGIAIQNFPEGAIIAMPMYGEGHSKNKSFLYGVLSGAVEPVAGFLTILFSKHVVPLMPYLLSFAAGAMLYVVVEELVPEMSQGEHSHAGVLAFAAGFCIMMILDVALG
ncbi:MAG TPA: ZIP zinc transporter [Erysipelotrichaceae bacterium]|nr:ZIP zinc transporter [Erysipelotrichaceae bacterium]